MTNSVSRDLCLSEAPRMLDDPGRMRLGSRLTELEQT